MTSKGNKNILFNLHLFTFRIILIVQQESNERKIKWTNNASARLYDLSILGRGRNVLRKKQAAGGGLIHELASAELHSHSSLFIVLLLFLTRVASIKSPLCIFSASPYSVITMGGRAFASRSPPINTPRMPPHIYERVLKTSKKVLSKYFSEVASAIESPGKTSYGDVDLIVTCPREDSFDWARKTDKQVAAHIAEVMNAKAWIRDTSNPTVNLAIPWPAENGLEKKDEYIQIDVHICPNIENFKWEIFHSAHGDLWNILGTIIRRFGLTANNRGLFLRIPEIEPWDRKKSMILLTADPTQVLEFLGLDEEKWWEKFKTQQDMFEYAADCRMFWVKEALPEDEVEGDVFVEAEGQEGGEKGKKKLKHNDRQRMNKRPVFAAWIDEFIPKCREEGKYREAKITRDEIRDDAFYTFSIQKEYEEILKEWTLSKHKEDLWRDVIKGGLPELDDIILRGAASKELREIIMQGKSFNGKVPEAASVDKNGFYDVDAVKAFVVENWKRAGEIRLGKRNTQPSKKVKM